MGAGEASFWRGARASTSRATCVHVARLEERSHSGPTQTEEARPARTLPPPRASYRFRKRVVATIAKRTIAIAPTQNRQRVEPGVSSAVPTAVAVRGLTS